MEPSRAGNQPGDSGTAVLAWVFYILAAIVLMGGILVGLTLLNYQVNLSVSLGPLGNLGAGSLLDAVGQALKATLSFIGMIVLLISCFVSALLFTCGYLLQRSRDLALRVWRLEQVIASGNRALPAP